MAVVLGVLGLAVLVDVLVVVLVAEHAPDLDGARTLLLVIVGALLIVAGVVVVDWSALRAGRRDDGPPAPPRTG